MRTAAISLTFFFLTITILLSMPGIAQKNESHTNINIGQQINKFAPTVITGDISKLSDGDKAALKKLFEAARLLDRIYTRQVWSGNEALRKQLEAKTSTDADAERLKYFNINRSPFSGLDGQQSFIEGVPSFRPDVANYYPEDMTKEEFEKWVATLPQAEQDKAKGFFYTIRRDKDGTLMTVPYNVEYKDLLEPAAALLRDAANLTTDPTLKTFLSKRADAFLSNDYYDSDVAWMNLDSPIDVTIGPYEVYMDNLFNYKAAFEAYINLKDDAETNKLAAFSSHLQEIEDILPIDPKYRNPKLGSSSPIRVVDELDEGGEARPGVQTAAYNLPNDERVTREKGSKRVMLKNVQEAKFKTILVPIAGIVLGQDQRKNVSFEPFFTHILCHELMHGLGPHTIVMNGDTTTVRQAMKELSSALEEAKADISGLFALQYLIDKGVVDKSMEENLYTTYLASIFRSVRFGIAEAHGKGTALQFNYLLDEGAFVRNDDGTFSVNREKIKDGVKKLTGEIMTIQAEGNYDRAKALLGKYGVIRPEMQSQLDRLTDLPVDILPSYPLAEQQD